MMLGLTLFNREIDNYKMVDIMKLIAAIMVICIHCSPIVPQENINFFIKSIVCRIAVPYFFISSAYFVRRGCSNKKHYLKSYLKGLSKSYLAWSIIFIPIGIDWINQNLALSQELLPFALIFGLLHVGTYYQLWYIPAMIFSLFFVDKLVKCFSYKIVFLIASMLFMFGSLETYYGLLSNGLLKEIFDIFIQIFFTTRTGLLFGMIFVTIGFFIYDYQEKLKSFIKHVPTLTIIFGGFLIAEGSIVYNIERLDMNFLLILVPFSFFFFLSVLSFPIYPKFNTGKIRELSKFYYFVHPICIVIVEEIGNAFKLDFLSSGILSFLLILLLTHLFSLSIIHIQKGSFKRASMALSVIIGVVVTLIIATIIYQFKILDVVLKFELVPCLWIFSSFIVYFLLHRRHAIS